MDRAAAATAERRQVARSDAEPLRQALRPRGPVHFAITQTDQGDAIALHIAGELDVLTAPKLAAEANGILRRSTQDVIIDLSQANFIDSAGLQILLGIHRRLTGASRKLTVECDEGPVRRVIELARLEETFGVVGASSSHGGG